MAQLIGRCPMQQKIAGSFLGLNPWLGHAGGSQLMLRSNIDDSLSLSLLPFKKLFF